MRTFIAFSKSDSSNISRVPSTNAAETAWRTSRPPLKDRLVVGVVLEVEEVVGVGLEAEEVVGVGLKEEEVVGEVEEDVG